MYIFHQIQTEDCELNACSSLFKDTYKIYQHLTSEYLKWQYVDNPAGQVIGFNAFSSGELIAHYACIPVLCNLNGIESRGLLSLNTATHPDHQGKGLFTKLANKTYDKAIENGFEFVVGVANANSSPGFINKLGFQLVGPLDARLGVGLPHRSVEGSKMIQFQRIWTQDLIEWRLANPSGNYGIKVGSDGRICVYAKTGWTGVTAVMFDSDKLGVSLPTQKPYHSRNPIKLWIGADPSVIWPRSFYYNIPIALRASPLNLIFKDLTKQNILLDPKNVMIFCLDFDAY